METGVVLVVVEAWGDCSVAALTPPETGELTQDMAAESRVAVTVQREAEGGSGRIPVAAMVLVERAVQRSAREAEKEKKGVS